MNLFLDLHRTKPGLRTATGAASKPTRREAMREALEEYPVLNFWLDLKVPGLQCDALKYLITTI